MSVANIESGGYDYEPVTEVSKDLSCVICFKLMRNPVQFNCGHGMCSSCYNDLVKNTEDRTWTCCPQCREQIHDCQVVKNLMIHRLILALKVKCKNADTGCEWTCDLSEMDNHLKCCPYEKINCPNGTCDVSVEKRHLHIHLSECIVKTLSESNRSVTQLKWATAKQDKEIQSLRSKLRESMSKQNKLEQEVGRLRDKLERVEHLNRSRNDKDAQGRLYEDVMRKISEISHRQNQMQYDLNSVRNNQMTQRNSPGVIQRLSPTNPPTGQEFDYELTGYIAENHHHALYNDTLPALQPLQQNNDSVEENTPNNLYLDPKKHQDRSTMENFPNLAFW